MISSNSFNNKTFLIIGMGLTGRSLCTALSKSKANIFYWDDDSKSEKSLRRLRAKKFLNKKKEWNKIDYIIPSPGITISGKTQHQLIYLAKKNKKIIISELDLFQLAITNNNEADYDGTQIVAVTGTNGKSTIVSLIHHLLKSKKINSSLIGNIGNSIFKSKVLKKGVYVIEVSSYQLESSKLFSPNIAVISNISSDHLDRHKSMQNYMHQKTKILKNLKKKDTAILNCNHSLIRSKALELLKYKKSNIITFNFRMNLMKLFQSDKNTLIKKKIIKIKHKNISLGGLHNQENIHIAYRVIDSLGLNSKLFKEELNNFKGLPHRQEVVFKNRNLTIINDSKATNIDSMITAIKNYQNIYLICGGILKEKNLSKLRPYTKKIKKVYITGLNPELFINFFTKSNKIFISPNLGEVVENCLKDVFKQKKVTILFCPGAASFDQFKNFEYRGKKFKELILRKIGR